MRVLATREFPPGCMRDAAAAFDLTVRDEALTPAAAREALEGFDAVWTTIGDDWSARAFDGAPHRCRLLANFGVGWNHIDGEAARAAGVMVTNTPDATTEPTADVALLLMLMTARKAGAGERLVRAGEWTGWGPGAASMGMHLGGRTLGIVGLGRIGKALARRARAIGMDVIHFNRSRTGEAGQVELSELMARADVVACCVPGAPSTHHLIGAAELAAMRPDAILVNVSRGDVVDEGALIAALEAGRIGGAGLDVYENEPEIPAALMREDTVLLPHIGTAAPEVREAMGGMAVANLLALAKGRELPDRVA
ncbi:2-hydroxyacid dehydrogenase [Hasllibacter halocynthiae]|uniref:2-hydroxyacid dehydrogenase n=1 Tax=Hasllibacter halocynthiae TaxID=595589 RepID=UPI000D07E8B1|nr:D-glycerate dehydrogenase [Hasllibacter halocynthiae]